MLDQDRPHSEILPVEREPETVAHVGYRIQISDEIEAPHWDRFLATAPGGHHVQTSLWAQVKALHGWRPARVVITCGAQIVAGAQVLLRPLPLIGAIGYIPKGPLIIEDDPLLSQLVIDALHEIAGAQRIRYLIVQPPNNGEVLAQQLVSQNFHLCARTIAPIATVLLDLRNDLDDILAQMKIKTRQNIRRSQRQGISVREGTEEDLPTYYRLLTATSRRQNFSIFPEEYFSRMWRILRPQGYIQMFIAEYQEEAVAAQLAISFGDTVINKLSAWSGHHGNRRPNEALQWASITWAKAHGYRYYDFEGISPKAARSIMRGERLPDSMSQTVTSFKLGFGGQVTLFPEAYDYICNAALRRAYLMLSPKVSNARAIKKVWKHFRTH